MKNYDAVDTPESVATKLYVDSRPVVLPLGRGEVYATPAARDAAIPAPTSGMTCFVTSLLQQQVRIGPNWTPVGGNMPAVRSRKTTLTGIAAGNNRFPFTPTQQVLVGGFTNSPGDGTLIVPASGMYHLHGQGIFQGMPANSVGALNVGTLTAAYGWGTNGFRDPANGYGTSMFSTNMNLTVGDKISLWTNVSAAMNIETAELFITYIGDNY